MKKISSIVKIIGYVVKIGGWLIDVIGSFPNLGKDKEEIKRATENERKDIIEQISKVSKTD